MSDFKSTQVSQEANENRQKKQDDQQPKQQPSDATKVSQELSKKRTLNEISNGNNGQKVNQSELKEESKQGEESKTEETCNICFEVLKEIKAVVDCGHLFCKECIEKWSKIENTCPYCKQEFKQIRIRKVRKNSRKRKPRLQRRLTKEITKNSVNLNNKGIKSSITSIQPKQNQDQSDNLDDTSQFAQSDNDVSEEINVIDVESKKQRVNENYIDIDSEMIRSDDDYDSEDYYEDDDVVDFPLYNFLDSRLQISLANTVVDEIPNEQLEHVAFQAVNGFLSAKIRTRITDWSEAMIIPERMREQFVDITSNRLLQLPTLIRRFITKYCTNNPETYHNTFPFIAQEDLINADQENGEALFIHVMNPFVNQLHPFQIPDFGLISRLLQRRRQNQQNQQDDSEDDDDENRDESSELPRPNHNDSSSEHPQNRNRQVIDEAEDSSSYPMGSSYELEYMPSSEPQQSDSDESLHAQQVSYPVTSEVQSIEQSVDSSSSENSDSHDDDDDSYSSYS